MEKKGDLLNQVAIIADLMEKANINFSEDSKSGLVFSLEKEEFDRISNYFKEKNISRKGKDGQIVIQNEIFYVYIGDIQIMFMVKPFSRNNA